MTEGEQGGGATASETHKPSRQELWRLLSHVIFLVCIAE